MVDSSRTLTGSSSYFSARSSSPSSRSASTWTTQRAASSPRLRLPFLSSLLWTATCPPRARSRSPCVLRRRGSSSCGLEAIHLCCEAGFEGNDGCRRRKGLDEPTVVLSACREDVVALWCDNVVREILKRKGVDVEHIPGSYVPNTIVSSLVYHC